MYWDLYVMLLAIYNCFTIPFDVAFQPYVGPGWFAWERLVDACFGLDLALNFRTTYVNEKTGFEITNQKMVAMNYIKSGRFFVDLGATLPLENIMEAADPKAN